MISFWLGRRAIKELADSVRKLQQNEVKIMSDLARLQADVAAQSAAVQVAIADFASAKSQISDLSTKLAGTDDQAALDAIATQMEASTAALSAAFPAPPPVQ